MRKALVRFPNESFHIEIEIEWDEFKIEKEFSDELFGWYRGTYISVLK